MSNQYEAAAREKRVRALVAHFDQWVTDAGHDPHANAEMVAETLTRMKPQIWDLNAGAAGLKKGPSATTRAAVIQVYLDRANSKGAPSRVVTMVTRAVSAIAMVSVLALASGCAGRVIDSPAESNTTAYTMPPLSCLFASADQGSSLSPDMQESVTAVYNTDPAQSFTTSVYCSELGACTVRVVTPDADPDCRDSIGAAVGVAHGAGQ